VNFKNNAAKPKENKEKKKMFDGNHRSRRRINLGGASSSSSRQRRTRTPSSSNNTSTAAAASKATARGIRDHKKELLEAARVNREQRRQHKKQVHAVTSIQRVYRAFRSRSSLAVELASLKTKNDNVLRYVRVVSMRLSPSLLPFISLSSLSKHQNNKQKEELELLLAMEANISPSSLNKIFFSQQNEYIFLMGRTAKRILHHLPSAPPQSQLRLANLLTAILLLPQHQHPASLLTAPTLTIANAIRTLTTSTSYQTNEPSALLMLFTSFQQLFWSSLHSSSLSAPQRTATRTLLYLSCTIAFALSSSAHKQQTKHAPSLLAAAIFCSGINIVNSNQDAKNAKDEQWRNDFHLCFSAITQQQQDVIHKQHAHEKQQHQTQWGWYTYLLSNLVSTLTTSASSTDALADQVASTTAPSQTPSPLPTTANSTEVNIISKTTLEMVKGRELYLLQNALHVFQSMQTTNYSTSSSETEIQTTIFANSMIQLLTHVLQTNKELAVLASCVAKGEDIRHFFPFQKDKEDTSKAVVDLTQHPDDNEDDAEESDDEDEDMEEEEETTNPTPPSMTATGRSAAHSTTTTSASSAKTTFKIKRHQRLTRQELQTLPKLDKLYQHDWLQVRRAVLSTLYHHSQQSNNHASSVDSMQLLLTLATQIGGGNWNNSPNDLIVHLGTFAFSSSQSTTSTTQTNAKDAYITLLTTLLQSCTSLRVSNNGENKPLLTKLAFHPDLLPSLWEYVQYKSTRAKAASAGGDGLMEALTCTFCDLFVHHLLAVDDEEFILSYTNKSRSDENDDGRRKKAIMAEDVILYLRSVLHELYWTRPVTASDVIVPVSSIHAGSDNDGADAAHMTARCHRARLLLSGTKLWNALHERWCRLLRTFPFCDEQVWWFPRLVSKERDDDGVFFVGESESSTRSSYAAGMGLEPVDSNDDDEDDDDGLDEDSTSSPMDVDEDDNNNSSSTAADAESDALASSFRDPKMARILTSIPQSIPFDRRVKLFESLLNADKARTQDETAAFRRMMMNMGNMDEMENGMMGREQVTIRRDNIYADSMKNLNKLGKKMRRKVQVTFINKHGAVEAGIDGGGVFKEFLDDLITEAFNPESGHVEDGTHGPLFGVTPLQTLHVGVSPDVGAFSADNSRVLSHYEFLGRVLGKAVYESRFTSLRAAGNRCCRVTLGVIDSWSFPCMFVLF